MTHLALTTGQWLHAVHMWTLGCDTLTIAEYFGCKEPVIYRWLPVYRSRYRTIGVRAA